MSRERASGYTLIEVLVALTILALTLTVLMRIFGGGARNLAAAADYTRAVAIAESVLASTGAGAPLAAGSFAGRDVDERFEWRSTITAFTPTEFAASDAVEAYRISVDVEWPGRTDPRTVHLATIKLQVRP